MHLFFTVVLLILEQNFLHMIRPATEDRTEGFATSFISQYNPECKLNFIDSQRRSPCYIRSCCNLLVFWSGN